MRVAIVILMSFLFCLPIESMYECVGLGETCTVAAALQKFELRNAAYPFDWVISPHQSLCNVLHNDFQDFLDIRYLSVRDDNKGVVNKYGLAFMHDFPTMGYVGEVETQENPLGEGQLRFDWIKFAPEVGRKYDRRIQRFRDLCNSDKKVYFIRHGGITSIDQACSLRDLLRASYPKLDFTLIIVGHNSSFAQPWGEKNIRNYYVPITQVWNDVAEWEKIFIDLGLLIDE
jgi:hypothetical protein